ncbi:MAG TPA: hypothetical protein VIO64_09935 [Pseudobacteroides sp.]|uniref:hypothetical protein n=1 Tax=Pseudobacteroides sp. TaxID=1968840 RepID=UPI002F94F1D4
MRKVIIMDDENSPKIELQLASFIQGIKLYVDGKEIKKSADPGKPYLVNMKNGEMKKIFIKVKFFDYIPSVIVDGKEILIAPKLQTYHYIIGGIPMLIVFLGGAIGAMVGFAGMMINYKIFRSKMNAALKILSVAGITLAVYITYLGLAFLIGNMLR